MRLEAACYLSPVRKQDLRVRLIDIAILLLIGIKILVSIVGFKTHMIEQKRQLVGVYYQLNRNSSKYLRNFNKVYTIGNIK